MFEQTGMQVLRNAFRCYNSRRWGSTKGTGEVKLSLYRSPEGAGLSFAPGLMAKNGRLSRSYHLAGMSSIAIHVDVYM